MAANKHEVTLRMDLVRETPVEGALEKCRVEYALPRVKNRIAGFLKGLLDNEDEDQNVDPATTEVMVITMEAIGDTFHAAALNQWNTNKLRISFFDARTLVSNPLEHFLVPKHELVPQDQHKSLLERYNCKSKLNFPMIRFHEDIIGRLIGLIPGDIVKITRPSPSAGEYIVYRVCVP
jgi:DNA-directed RNA polymerase subunit H (RpoH/RPB5)